MGIPRWAPDSVVTLWEEAKNETFQDVELYGGASELTLEIEELLFRIITNPNMKYAWEKVQNTAYKPKRQPKTDNAALIAMSTKIAFIGPSAPSQRLTPKKREEFIEEATSLTNQLIRLVRNSELDRFHQREHWDRKAGEYVRKAAEIFRHGEKYIDCPTCKKYQSKFERWDRTEFSETLLAFQKMIPKLVGQTFTGRDALFLPSPGHKDARRIYFVRYLTRECRQFFGQPLRRVVTDITNASYPDAPLDERTVIRLAP